MTKLTLNDVANLQNESSAVTALTTNNRAIETAIENTVSRDGTTPNHMNADFDMNSNRILNLPDGTTDQEPATYGQLVDFATAVGGGAVVDAQYLTLSNDPTLLNERVLTAGTGIDFVDTGADGTLTVNVDASEVDNQTGTLTNKTIDLTDNTLTGTTAQFNTALSDNDFATLAGAETLTNKTLTSPSITTPTGIVKGDVGLGNVDNTSDVNKPVSTAQAAAIAVVQSDIDTHEANVSNPHSVTKAQVGLSNVDNTSDATKNAAAVTLTNKTLTAPVMTAPVLGTPASGTLTNTTGLPVSTGISGLGTGVATFLATPSSANLRTALTDEVGTGAAYFVGGALGTPASGVLTNATGLPLSGIATQAAYTLVGNNTGSSASPAAVDIATVTTKATPGAGDYILISDQAASGAFKKVTVSSVGASSGVSSIAGNTGAFTLANGITNNVNSIELTAARRTLPTTQVFSSGSGTYTTPANCLWIEVFLQGGGGGGGGSGTSAGSAPGAGGNSTFSTFTASGGAAASWTANGPGGGGSGGYLNHTGGSGQPGIGLNSTPGGQGGVSFLGGTGFGGTQGGSPGSAAPTNSGGGGGGGGAYTTSGNSGGAGGAGGYVQGIINSPAASYSYAVGAGGAAGGAGAAGYAGGAGGSGRIWVIEHYGT